MRLDKKIPEWVVGTLYELDGKNSLEKMEMTASRSKFVQDMRKRGETFKEIGILLNISPSRASRIYLMHARNARRYHALKDKIKLIQFANQK